MTHSAEELKTARAIVADCPRHPDRTVYRAAVAVYALSSDQEERQDAYDLAQTMLRTGGEWVTCPRCPGEPSRECLICDGAGGQYIWPRTQDAEAAA